MAVTTSIPISRRSGEDLIVRGDEKYLRKNLDRSIGTIDFIFSTLGNRRYGTRPRGVIKVHPWQYPENTPTQVASRIVRATGHVAIADIGCGTGNTLLSWGNKIASQTRCGLGAVSMLGVSRQDFRGESLHPGTNAAFRRKAPPADYQVANAMRMAAVASKSQDVILAFNSMRFAAHPEYWLLEMLRIARPGGSLIFNTDFEAGKDGHPLVLLVDKLHEAGCVVHRDNFMIPDFAEDAPPVQWQVLGGMTDDHVLYRIDVPAASLALTA